VTPLDAPAAPSCPLCGSNEAVTREHFAMGARWYCLGECGATVFEGTEDEWRSRAKTRDQLRRHLENQA
jgi:hypothetical protein